MRSICIHVFLSTCLRVCFFFFFIVLQVLHEIQSAEMFLFECKPIAWVYVTLQQIRNRFISIIRMDVTQISTAVNTVGILCQFPKLCCELTLLPAKMSKSKGWKLYNNLSIEFHFVEFVKLCNINFGIYFQ